MTKIINLTPHTINLVTRDGDEIETYPSQGVARVFCTPGEVEIYNGIPIAGPDVWGEVEELPSPKKGVFYIVSALVGGHPSVKGERRDVLVPGTGPGDGALRNEKGHIVGVTRFKRV